MNAQPTRRGILGAMAVMPVVGMARTAHALPAASGNIRSAIAKYHAAVAASDAHYEAVFEPSYERFKAAQAAIPPVVIPYKDEALFDHELRSDDDWSLWAAKEAMAGRRKDLVSAPGLYRTFTKKLGERELSLAGVLEAHRPAMEESDRYNDISCKACDSVMETPVASVSELIDKTEFMLEHAGDIDDRHLEQVVSDLRRLAARAGC